MKRGLLDASPPNKVRTWTTMLSAEALSALNDRNLPSRSRLFFFQPEGSNPFRLIFSGEVNHVWYGHSAQHESVPASRRVGKFCGSCRAVESFHRDDQQAPDVSREAFGI